MNESLLSLYSDGSNVSVRSHNKLIEVGSWGIESEKEGDGSMETRYTKRFVLPIDLSQQLVDFSESSRVNVALRCVNSIQRLQESIQSETPVVVSARVALSEDAWNVRAYKTVSYTHLDVYKRQV